MNSSIGVYRSVLVNARNTGSLQIDTYGKITLYCPYSYLYGYVIIPINSNQAITITNVKTSILKTKITLLKAGNIVVISYTGDTIDNVKRGDLQVIGTIPPDYVPRQRIVIAPIQSTPQQIQLIFENNGNITAYNYGNEITAQTTCRYNGCYVC